LPAQAAAAPDAARRPTSDAPAPPVEEHRLVGDGAERGGRAQGGDAVTR